MARELIERGNAGEAYLLARQALDAAPHDPLLQQLWLDLSLPQVVTTEPAGAEVAIAPYRDRRPTWVVLGRTPLPVRLPRGQIRMRLSKAGYQMLHVASEPPQKRYRLDPVGTVPPGMVRVTAARCRNDSASRRRSTTSGSPGSRSRTGSSRRSWIRAAT